MNSVNRSAFLHMIAVSELGNELIAASDRGYNVMVGSTPDKPDLFTSYRDHPRRVIALRNKLGHLIVIDGKPLRSSAAGRYQILARYFDAYQKLLNLPDFSPASQDAIALQMIKECRAFAAIDAGDIATAIHLCKSRWASLPGAGYGQHENSLKQLAIAFVRAGGQAA